MDFIVFELFSYYDQKYLEPKELLRYKKHFSSVLWAFINVNEPAFCKAGVRL